MKTRLTADLTVAQGETVAFTASDQGYELSGYKLTNGGTITLIASTITGSSGMVGLNGNYTNYGYVGGSFVNQATGVFKVNGSGAAGIVMGINGMSSVENAGLVEITGTLAATGYSTYDIGVVFSNTGTFTVTSASSAAYGVQMNNGGTFTNTGTVEVHGAAGAYGVAVRTFSNAGTIRAVASDAGATSIAVTVSDGSASVITNEGLIEGQYAIVAHGNYVPEGAITQTVNNTGQINGIIDLGRGDDIVNNSGGIGGQVWLGAGADTYNGQTGSQTAGVLGGWGADTLNGGAAADWLWGEFDKDTINGGGGDDVIDGGYGDDVLDGGSGFDTITFQASTIGASVDLGAGTADANGHDTLQNFERVVGSKFGDVIKGGASAETLEGRTGADTLNGGGGDDTLIGGTGADALTGGAGADTFVFASGDGQDVVTDYAVGSDHLQINGYGGYQSLTQDGADTVIVLSATDSIRLQGVTASTLTGGAAAVFVASPPTPPAEPTPPSPTVAPVTLEKNFTIGAGELFQIVTTSDGFFLEGYNGPHPSLYVNGTVEITSSGQSTVKGIHDYGRFGSAVLAIGANGAFTVESTGLGVAATGMDGSNNLHNNGLFSVVSAGDATGVNTSMGYTLENVGQFHIDAAGKAIGATIYNGGFFTNSGVYEVNGDAGATGLVLNGASASISNSGTVTITDQTAARDSVAFMFGSYNANQTFTNTGSIVADYVLKATYAAVTLDNQGSMQGVLEMSGYADHVANSGQIVGSVYLNAGADVYVGTSLSTVNGVYGGDGNDTIFGGGELYGEAGDDSLQGSGGADVLRGGDGADSLGGGAGADTLDGGSGDDVLTGGVGDDLYFVDSARDQIVEWSGEGWDTVEASTDYVLGANVEALIFLAGGAHGVGNAEGNWLVGNNDANWLEGLDGRDYLFGNGGDDVLAGGRGADVLEGGTGADVLDGGQGGDDLTGGAGADVLTGGTGSDTFRGSLAELNGDTITDLTALDAIVIIDANLATLAVSRQGSTVTLSGGTQFTLAGNPRGELVASADADGGVRLHLVPPKAPANDINSDGHSDLLWRHSAGYLTIWLGGGDAAGPGFAANVWGAAVSPGWRLETTLDFNGDGAADLMWRHANGTFSIWDAAGGGFTANSFVNSNVSADWKLAGTGDFDGDGKSDLLWRHASGTFTEWRSTGGGFEANVVVDTLAPEFKVAAIGDFTGDGVDDVLWRSDRSGVASVYASQGDSFFASALLVNDVGLDWTLAGHGDFNGDGKEDIIWRNASGAFTEWQSTGTGFIANVLVDSSVNSAWSLTKVADYNGDGRDDMMWRHPSGVYTIWQSTGNGFAPNVYVDASVSADWLVV